VKHAQRLVTATIVAAGLFQGAAFAAGAGEPQAASGAQQAAARPSDPIRDCLEERVRSLRAEYGVGSVTEHATLATIAIQHSAEMAAAATMYHTRPEVLQGLPAGWRAYGEDVVFGMDCDSMWDAFMNSPPHREIILRPDFNYSGVATSKSGDGTTFATVVFMRVVPIALTPLLPLGPLGKSKVATAPTPTPIPSVPAPTAPAATVGPISSPSPEVPVIGLTPGGAASAESLAVSAEGSPAGPATVLGGAVLTSPNSVSAQARAAGTVVQGSGPIVTSRSDSYRQDLEVEPGLARPRQSGQPRRAARTGPLEITFQL